MKNYLQRRNTPASVFDVFEDDFFKPVFVESRQDLKTDIKETETGYELDVEIPGYTKDQIKVSLENGYLVINCKKEQKENDEGKKNGHYLRREISESCRRSYYVGNEISREQIKAKYDNGMLRLTVPKEAPKSEEEKSIVIE